MCGKPHSAVQLGLQSTIKVKILQEAIHMEFRGPTGVEDKAEAKPKAKANRGVTGAGGGKAGRATRTSQLSPLHEHSHEDESRGRGGERRAHAREQQQQQCASEPEITLSLPPTETNVPSGLDAFLRLRQCAQRGQPTRDSNSEEAQQQHQQRQEEVPQQHQHQPPQQRPENPKQPKNDQPTTGSPSSLAPNLLCFVSDKVLQHMDLTLALEDK